MSGPPALLYQGVVDANAALAAAVAQLNALDPQPDLVLLTGDVAEAGTAAEYAAARAILAPLRAPLRVIPGNHDEREAFRQAFHDHGYLPATGPLHYVEAAAGPVRVIALDVTLPGPAPRRGRCGGAGLAGGGAGRGSRHGRRSSCCTSRRSNAACPISTATAAMAGEALAALLRRYPGGRAGALRPCAPDHAAALRRHAALHRAEHRDGDRAAAVARCARRPRTWSRRASCCTSGGRRGC